MTGWTWVRVAAVVGFLGVSIGAFGAHGLKDRLEALGTTATFQTGVQYHFHHVMALLAVGLLALHGSASRTALNVAGWSFLLGVLIFSGSLYVLGVTGLRWLGAITPIGGVAFLVGWAALAVAAASPPALSQRGRPTPAEAVVDSSALVETLAEAVDVDNPSARTPSATRP